MSNIMDEFVLNHTLQDLQKQVDENQTQAVAYYEANDLVTEDLIDRVTSLENVGAETGISLDSIQSLVESLQQQLADTNAELNKTKLVNLKQELVVRTLHNMTAFNGTDMYADTFANGEAIDWVTSIRAELLTEYQAVGRTRKSVIVVNQAQAPSFNLIYQTFLIDKDRQIDKVSLLVESYNQNTYQPLTVSIHETETGPALTSADIRADDAIGGWIDLVLPSYILTGNKEYHVRLTTEDIYGYKIGMDTLDHYLPGTAYSLFGGVWTDNNYDIGFKVWCYPSLDESDATIITVSKVYPTTPEYIVFEAQEVDIDGGITYYVSRNAGSNWKILQPGIETNLNDLPDGKTIVLKAIVTGSSRIEAWGYVIKRSDT
jgi:hypothetical protein